MSTVPFNFFPKSEYLASVKESVCQGFYPVNEKNVQIHESRKSFILETFLPFLLAGCGMVGAGVLLENASDWTFLTEVPEALVLVPALLGLKGNLEMTLASRLSTMANLGLMDERKQQLSVLLSNVSLIQAQAIVVSLVAATLAIFSYQLEGNPFNLARSITLILTATLTASVASFLLATLMVFLAVMARQYGINPDNIATPVAAATGDIVFGTFFYNIRESFMIGNIILLLIILLSVFWWMWAASRQAITREVLKYGWFAVLIAMTISSIGGFVMRHSVDSFPSIALFQPVINGVGGNLVAVQASKISTYLHQFGKKGVLPENTLSTYLNPLRVFSCKDEESIHSLILLFMCLPGHIIFMGLIYLVKSSSFSFSALFFLFYLICAFIQVAILLYICQALSRIIWKMKCNPDNNSIPLLTSLGDLLGTVLLAMAFYVQFNLQAQQP